MANPPDPFERFLLKSVDVKNVACPVVDSGANPTKTHFSIGPTRIWQRDVDAPLNRNQPKDQDNQGIPENSDVVPLVVMRNKADLVVKLIIAKDPAGYAKEAGQWHAYLYPEAEEQKNTIVTYMSFAPPLASQDPELSIILPLAIKKLPWEFKGRYKLRIYREGVQFNSLVLETVLNLELYVVVSSLAPFFDRNGIPLSLLRFPGLISSWKTSDLPFWHEYVIKTIFENPHLQYDSYDGKAKYTGLSGWSLLHNQDDQKTTIAMCWLDLFISDLEGLERRNDNTRYAVNCFDLAAISQVFLALGTYPEVIRAVFMKPFGFIKAARFIGNTKEYCNNPIFRGPGYNTSLLCSPTAINRSGFSCHLFLAMDDWADEVIGERRGEITTVLDACCGPQLGRLRIGPQPEEYPSEILDPSKPAGAKSNGVYSLLIGPDGKLIGDPGVKELASSASFNRPTQRIDVQDDARYKMMSHRMLYDDNWATIGDVEQPVISALSGRDFVNATYTVRPKNTVDDDLWTINLARYWFDEDAPQAFKHQKTWLETPYNEGKWGGVANRPIGAPGGFYMFYSDPVLVKIESKYAPSSALVPCGDLIKSFIDDMEKKKWKVIQGMEPEFIPTGHVGTTFQIRLTSHGHADFKGWWKGYSVTSENGNAMYLDSRVNGDESVVITFLRRKAGTDRVSIILYGGNLEIERNVSNQFTVVQEEWQVN